MVVVVHENEPKNKIKSSSPPLLITPILFSLLFSNSRGTGNMEIEYTSTRASRPVFEHGTPRSGSHSHTVHHP